VNSDALRRLQRHGSPECGSWLGGSLELLTAALSGSLLQDFVSAFAGTRSGYGSSTRGIPAPVFFPVEHFLPADTSTQKCDPAQEVWGTACWCGVHRERAGCRTSSWLGHDSRRMRMRTTATETQQRTPADHTQCTPWSRWRCLWPGARQHVDRKAGPTALLATGRLQPRLTPRLSDGGADHPAWAVKALDQTDSDGGYGHHQGQEGRPPPASMLATTLVADRQARRRLLTPPWRGPPICAAVRAPGVHLWDLSVRHTRVSSGAREWDYRVARRTTQSRCLVRRSSVCSWSWAGFAYRRS